jgi:hypothetical protein
VLTSESDGLEMTAEPNLTFNGSKLDITGSCDVSSALTVDGNIEGKNGLLLTGGLAAATEGMVAYDDVTKKFRGRTDTGWVDFH